MSEHTVTLGSLFTGYGGLDMAAAAAFNAKTVWVSDIKPAACKLLAHRFPDVPNLGDITKINWAAVEPVDVLTGGFPCQDVSNAGNRAGMREGTRSNLWLEMLRAIDQLKPPFVVIENVRGLLSAEADSNMEHEPGLLGNQHGKPVLRALGRVLGGLADLGYDAQWRGLRAADVGAPHGRFRVFILATPTDPDGDEPERRGKPRQLASTPGKVETGRAERERDGHAASGRGEAATDPGRLRGFPWRDTTPRQTESGQPTR